MLCACVMRDVCDVDGDHGNHIHLNHYRRILGYLHFFHPTIVHTKIEIPCMSIFEERIGLVMLE